MIFWRAPTDSLIEARLIPPWGALSLRDASLSWSWDAFQVPEHPRPAVKRYDIDTLSCILLKASCGLAEWNLYLKYTNYCQGRDGTRNTVKGPNALLNPPEAGEREKWSHCLCSNNRKGGSRHHTSIHPLFPGLQDALFLLLLIICVSEGGQIYYQGEQGRKSFLLPLDIKYRSVCNEWVMTGNIATASSPSISQTNLLQLRLALEAC